MLKPLRIPPFILFLLVALHACAPVTSRPTFDPELAQKEAAIQRRMAVEEKTALVRRLNKVAHPILANNASLCGDEVAFYTGLEVGSLSVIAKEWQEANKDAFGLDENVRVTHILEESPAWKSGFKIGDIITYINGVKIEPGEDGYETYRDQLEDLLETGDEITFWVEREGLPIKLSVKPAERCGYQVVMTEDIVVNAYANGEAVMVTKGMMNFARDNEELALVIGHEVGHNVMGHIDKAQGNQVMGAIVDGVLAGLTGVYTNTFQNAAGMAFSQDFEQEADYVGLYFMERGGFDSKNAPNFWRRMGANNPYAIGHATTHPTSASRYVFLGKCHEEITEKRLAGEELIPEMDAD